jgi:hypothetical protein
MNSYVPSKFLSDAKEYLFLKNTKTGKGSMAFDHAGGFKGKHRGC